MNILKTFALTFAFIALVVPSLVFAVNLTVDFERDPLFGETNVLPGDVKDGDVTVTNSTDSTQSVYAESVNGYDPDGLGSQMRIRILEGATELYDDVFSTFLSAGPVSLSSLGVGAGTTYTFEVSFLDSADNNYQEKTLGFDLCIGFSGGQLQCGDTVISDPEDETPGGGGGGGGGGGSGSGGGSGGGGGGGGGPLDTQNLIIFNERVLEVTVGDIDAENGTAVIAWSTNLLATSQVVYGLKSTGPYSLNITNTPYFGYPMGNVEDPTKVIEHSMVITGLIPGETYVFRVVSRASPPTVSNEHEFALAVPGVGGTPGPGGTPGTLGGSTPGGSGTGAGGTSGLGGAGGDAGSGSGSDTNLNFAGNAQAAAAFLGLPSALFDIFTSWECMVISLLVLLAIYAIWTLVARLLHWDALNQLELARRRIISFFVLLILATVIAIIFKYFCIVIPLMIAAILAAAWFLVLLLRGDDTPPPQEPPQSEKETVYHMPAYGTGTGTGAQ